MQTISRMNKLFVNLVLLVGLSCVLLSCEDDPKLPDNIVEFEASVAGISEDEESLEINVNLLRETSSDAVLTFSLESNGVAYGTDFTLTPAPVGNTITLTIPEGETQASITLAKTAGVLLDGDE